MSLSTPESVQKLQAALHDIGPVSKAYRAVDRHTCKRLRQWLCAKHKKARLASRKYSDAYLHDKFGLVRLAERTRNFSWAKP
jgi:hypothetical protein